MIYEKEYIDWYFNTEKPKMLSSGCFGSEPIFLFNHPDEEKFNDDFDYWEFNNKNWNGGDILRCFLYKSWYEDVSIEGLEIKRYRVDDTWYVFLFTKDSFYTIEWYKSRGRTDFIRKNGYDITLKEYIELCNILGVELK